MKKYDIETRKKLYELHEKIDLKIDNFKKKLQQIKDYKIYKADEELQTEIQIFNNDIVAEAKQITEDKAPKSVLNKQFIIYKKDEIDKINIYKNTTFSVRKLTFEKLLEVIELQSKVKGINVDEDIDILCKIFKDDDIVTTRKMVQKRFFKSFKEYQIVDNNKHFLSGVIVNKHDNIDIYDTQKSGRKPRNDTKIPLELSDEFFELMNIQIIV